MNIKSKFLLQSFGLILFYIVISRLDLAEVGLIITGINIYYFLIANILFIFLVIIKSIRWQSLMNAQNIVYSLNDSAIIYAAAIFIGSITPGNLGDFVKVLYLKEDGHQLGRSFISVLLDRIFDVFSILVLGLIGFSLLMNSFQSISLIVSLMLFAALFAIVSIKNIKIKSLFSTFFQRFAPNQIKTRAPKIIKDSWIALSATGPRQLIYATLLTAAGWFLYFSAMCLLAFSIHIPISLLHLIICISVAHIATLIPISIAGIGTRDASLIALFSYLGYSKESALALSMIMLAFYISNLLLCLVAWLIKPVDLSQVRKPA